MRAEGEVEFWVEDSIEFLLVFVDDAGKLLLEVQVPMQGLDAQEEEVDPN